MELAEAVLQAQSHLSQHFKCRVLCLHPVAQALLAL
jgi:hypothetical protein